MTDEPANDTASRDDVAAARAVERVAVVGAGVIGASWAALFLGCGLDVVVTDPAADAEATTRAFVEAAWPELQRLGLKDGASPSRLSFVPDLREALAGADFVQENAPERENFKVDLFSRIDGLLPPEVVIASSSSGLSMSRIQSECRHPERCVIGHPFNPPHIVPLVEVVGGDQTSRHTIDRAMDFYRRVGKKPIHVKKEVMGHVANRLQAALWREAVHLIDQGVVSVADLDTAVAEGPGLRWAIYGPNMIWHLAGGAGGFAAWWDRLSGPTESWWPDLGSPTLSPAVRDMLVEGVGGEVGGRSIASLTAERDRLLVEFIEVKARATARSGAPLRQEGVSGQS